MTWSSQRWTERIQRYGGRTLVFLVRFSTSPSLMMRSNSKLPFCATGDMGPYGEWPLEVGLRTGIFGAASVRPGFGMSLGREGVATLAMTGEQEVEGREFRQTWIQWSLCAVAQRTRIVSSSLPELLAAPASPRGMAVRAMIGSRDLQWRSTMLNKD